MKKIAALLVCSFLLIPSRTMAASDDLSQGLFWLYHLRYDKAVELYDHHIAAHPEDPAGYFYRAATHWWHLAQEFEYSQPDIEKQFDDSVTLTIQKSEASLKALKESDPDYAKHAARVYLYWGGAEGLRGRWLVTQKHWIKAYFSGRTGFLYLKKALKLDPTTYDAYMGLGIYDYFSDTLSGFLGAISAIFVRGDRVRGIQQLELAIEKSSHARVEAMVFLCEIYTFEEKQPEKAIVLTEKLSAEFPNSPMAALAHIMALYQANRWDDVIQHAQIYLEKSQSETPEYNLRGGPPALYCLGIAHLWGKHDPKKALTYFERILEKASLDDPNRWISFALLRRAQIRDIHGERAKALEDYQRVLARQDTWGTHKEAREYSKKAFSVSH